MTEPTAPPPADPYQPAATPTPPGAPYPPAATPTPPAAPYPPAATPTPPGAPYPPAAMPYPSSAAPYPTSATPYPTSVMPYPGSGTPYGLLPPPKKSPWTIVFGVAALVLLLASGGVGALYVLDHNDASKTSSDQAAEIDSLRDQLEQAQDDLSVAERDLADLEADTKGCSDAVDELFNYEPVSSTAGNISAEDQAAITDLTVSMFRACGAL